MLTYYVPILLISIFVDFIIAIITCSIAENKNRNGFGWFLLSLLFGIIPLIIICCLDPLKPENSENNTNIINSNKNVAIICDKCGNNFVIDNKTFNNIGAIMCSKCKNIIDLSNIEHKTSEFKDIKIDKNFVNEEDNFFTINCPSCKKELTFPKLDTDKIQECPYCNHKIHIEK